MCIAPLTYPMTSAYLTPHFSLQELTRTDTGLENDPPVEVAGNLMRTAQMLEQVRSLLRDEPLKIHSGFRSVEVNRAVGGHPASAHLTGRAADFHPVHHDIRLAFEAIQESGLPYDKLLLEHKGGSWWIHLQVAEQGKQPRRYSSIIQMPPVEVHPV